MMANNSRPEPLLTFPPSPCAPPFDKCSAADGPCLNSLSSRPRPPSPPGRSTDCLLSMHSPRKPHRLQPGGVTVNLCEKLFLSLSLRNCGAVQVQSTRCYETPRRHAGDGRAPQLATRLPTENRPSPEHVIVGPHALSDWESPTAQRRGTSLGRVHS